MQNYDKIDKSTRIYQSSSYKDLETTIEYKALQNKLNELFKDPWFDYFSKRQLKLEYDYNKYIKLMKNRKRVIEELMSKQVKLRQCYDKFYRWVF